jgi:hypothetical protein
MPKITQISIDEVISRTPLVEQLDGDSLAANPPNAFVCAQGFEDRCDAIAKILSSKRIRVERVIVISLRSNSDEDRENGRRISEMLSPSAAHEPVILDADEPGFQHRFKDALGGDEFVNNEQNHILLDISVAANRACVRTFASCLGFNCQLTVGYTEAAVYHPTIEEFRDNESAWMSEDSLGTEKGVEDISPCEEFPGEHLEAASNVVVLLPSFRHERSAATVSHVDPALLLKPGDDVIWVLGCPHLPEDHWRRDAMRTLNRIADDAKIFEASTFDYREVWRILESVYDGRWEASNLTLSPLGSKLQAIGATLFCLRHSDVRILFSVPKEYNRKQWSKGVRDLWQISFGCGHKFLADVQQAGALRLEGFEA